MAWDAAQVEAAQNATPTDWSKYDQQLMDRNERDNRFAKDDTLHVRFSMRAVIDQEASDKAQRPIFKDTEYVEIMMPGEKHNIISRPAASMRDDLRFPKQYAQFKAGVTEQLSGTPLRILPFMSDAIVEELAMLKVRTVEQLVNYADSSPQFMGVQTLKARAKEYLDMTQGGAAMKKRLDDLQAQNEELRAQLQQQAKPPVAAKQQTMALSKGKAEEDILG